MNKYYLHSNCGVAECFEEKSSWCWNEQVCHGVCACVRACVHVCKSAYVLIVILYPMYCLFLTGLSLQHSSNRSSSFEDNPIHNPITKADAEATEGSTCGMQRHGFYKCRSDTSLIIPCSFFPINVCNINKISRKHS